MHMCPKAYKILLISLIAFGIFSIAGICTAQEVIRIPDDVLGPPYLLDQAGKTYVLTQDISAPGTCFIADASYITLDLNGHTVTYNTEPGDNVYGFFENWNKSNLRVTNGSFVQGAGNGYKSIAVFFRETSHVEADHLYIAYQGDDNEGITARGSGTSTHDAQIHDNIIRPNGTKRSLTHYGGFSAINVVATGGDIDIYNNDIQGKGNGGINFGYSSSPPLTDTLHIINNTIKMASPVRGGYAISVGSPVNDEIGFEIANNTINQSNGRGILVAGNNVGDDPGPGTGTVHDNSIEVRESMDSGEYAGSPGTGIGIQLRFGAHNIKVYNNTVKAHAGKNACPPSFPSQQGSDCEAIGIKVIGGRYAVNNQVYNNTVIVDTNDPDLRLSAKGLYGDGPADANTSFHHNTVTSNSILVDVNGADGAGSNFTFTSNTFIKGANPQNFHSIRVIYWGNSTNNVFLDNNWQNGATGEDLTAVNGGGTFSWSYYVKWYLDVTAKDGLGNPVSGATVNAAATGGGAETLTATTDAADRARLILTEHYRAGTTSSLPYYTNYTPHTLTVTKDGYETSIQEITMDASKSLTVTLVPTVVNTPPFASDLSRVKAYPNPYKGDKHSQVVFDNLTANIKIRIYTLKGELVREIKEQDGDRAYWDVKNKQGEKVTSGIYIYYITNPKGQERKGRIAIIR